MLVDEFERDNLRRVAPAPLEHLAERALPDLLCEVVLVHWRSKIGSPPRPWSADPNAREVPWRQARRSLHAPLSAGPSKLEYAVFKQKPAVRARAPKPLK